MIAAPPTWDAETGATLARLLDLPRVEVMTSVRSTMDVAHTLGSEGAAAGTLVLADEQTAGRGRGGKPWRSQPGAGIWMTLLERPNDPDALRVLSIRLGLKAAPVLQRFTDERVELKWPNDLLLGGRKLAGILVETRWRERQVDWVAIGVGVNVGMPDEQNAAGLREGVRRIEVLAELIPALRAAVLARGVLSPDELERWASRDAAVGRRCRLPTRGVVRGLAPDGSLMIESDGETALARAGSLVLEEGP
ncbi:MAG TPA: biotin--[acetyl-CoA-carboxylase] ligase [Gemmatimonadaceae bacterium]|nr:biotin--[acetyl-CoA-carboxylase] ligase [Gemmatimonadaceae bacterium]